MDSQCQQYFSSWLPPEKGLDAIREISRIIADMDYIIAKKTSPFSPAVFGCGMMSGGNSQCCSCKRNSKGNYPGDGKTDRYHSEGQF